MSLAALPSLPVLPLTIARLDAMVFRYPVKTPVRTSFGVMHDRPALFVRVEDTDGAVGWGEVWCNFPGCGAEHRARLLDTVMAPLLVGRAFDSAQAAFAHLSNTTAVLAIQSGEPGPIAQTIAGIDLALWDLCARRAGLPLWRLLGGTHGRVPVYASGLNPDRPEELALQRRAEGYRAFKLKVGFGEARDIANLEALRLALGNDTPLMVDANQAWSLAQAQHMAARIAPFGLGWLEEPLRADRPWSEWRTLQQSTPLALAGGENLAGDDAFDAALQAQVLTVLQPDAAKWGGISGCWPVVRRAQAAGLRYCPHYLGAGVGLLASAHLLAAAGGDGMLEVDANPNPLRTALSPPLQRIEDGMIDLGELPGIGVEPDPARIADAIASAT
ncbi:mandelate racemase/muconate lactonizing enzyme family protein [Acidovorax cavernicola]|uniref:Mandelate racemase/muconate lactonizing enzyme family protein n=1 Tax=Acidovorax cavernicola TaxID=1675792 RepID=A0A9X8D1I0_9BURK|nr:mandelate racemase/muconate lactonizing enzyme family protein [Acidovorax cavernicola]RIX76243.1 mandelate racemase/muconate lactonizing enzyme family protein [Acidovorax cavernicola]